MPPFQIQLLHQANPDLCFFGAVPDDTEMTSFRMAQGERNAHEYDPKTVIRMQDKEPGRLVPDIAPNTLSLLIVSGRVKEALMAFDGGSLAGDHVEYLPLTILNHKGRVASDDHWIINPIGTFDCEDREASVIKWFEDTEKVISVKKMVLSPKKLETAPALFRPMLQPRRYFVRPDLADALRSLELVNLSLEEIEVAES